MDLISKLVRLICNLFTVLGVDCVVVGEGIINKDMKLWIIGGGLKINNPYLPFLNKTDTEKRNILNEISQELLLLGKVPLV